MVLVLQQFLSCANQRESQNLDSVSDGRPAMSFPHGKAVLSKG